MEKYKLIKPGENSNFNEKISDVQRRAGINVTGVLDFETKKLFVIPRCGNTDAEGELHPNGGRPRRNKRSYIGSICSTIQVSMRGAVALWLVGWTPDRAVRVRALAGALRCVLGQGNLLS